MTSETRPDGAGGAADEVVTTSRSARPWSLLVMSAAVAAVLLAPLAFLVLEAHGAGAATIGRLIWRPLTATLLWNTVRLTVVVTVLCVVIGTLAAWCVERTDLPGRHVWAVLVVVPFAIPDFVVSFGWASLSTWVEGFRGAVLVMTLAVYPLVYLPVAASLRSADPALEEIARSLGVSRARTFVRVTLGQARGAILGGCVLVALVILAEYGAFEILGYQTFTTEIFTEYGVSFDVPAACSLSLVLVVLGIVVLGGEGFARGKGRPVRTGPLAQRALARHHLGRAKLPVLAGFVALVGPWASLSGPASTGSSRVGPTSWPASPWSVRAGTRRCTAVAPPPWPPLWRSRWPCSPCATRAAPATSSSAAATLCWPCRAS